MPPRRTAAPPPNERVTLRVLADHLGLSPASVSIVLNRAPAAAAIPRATQERIIAAAARFRYRPHTIASSLRRRRSLTIGVLVPEISEGYTALVMSGIEDELLQDGYLYFVASHRHRPDLIDEYARVMVDRSVDGIIAVDTPVGHALPVPVVAVSGHQKTRGVTNIVVNHERAAALALEHLETLGHRRIAVIKGQRFSSDTAVRWRAIRTAARRRGLSIDPSLTVQLEGDSPFPELGYLVTRRLVEQAPPFTALFAFNDISAIGAIRALREAGRRVPEDVSVVGFDDIPSAAYQHPGLTTVRQPLREMGTRAAAIMLERVERRDGGNYPRLITVDPQLIVRETTCLARPV
jgi:DNA-binding LacI/PurR family transcriptional regulator